MLGHAFYPTLGSINFIKNYNEANKVVYGFNFTVLTVINYDMALHV